MSDKKVIYGARSLGKTAQLYGAIDMAAVGAERTVIMTRDADRAKSYLERLYGEVPKHIEIVLINKAH